MKPVQLLFDEELLAELDSDERVQRVGRSEVLRELAASYLRKRREAALDARYAEGYGGGASKVSEELEGWVEEGVWPDD
jgi:metal-responsive CopG/Arc/MetJ family transcriptional regulator